MSKKGQGKAYQWVLAHQNYAGDDCQPWPFAKNWDGYGMFGYLGKQRKSARFMCEMVNGPAPSQKHQAAHSCGNGHLGCVNPRHLSWKTASQNQMDRRRHGTQHGARWSRTNLTPSQVADIRRSKGSETQMETAKRLNVTRSRI